MTLKYDNLLSSFAFNFNLRRYNEAVERSDTRDGEGAEKPGGGGGLGEGGGGGDGGRTVGEREALLGGKHISPISSYDSLRT